MKWTSIFAVVAALAFSVVSFAADNQYQGNSESAATSGMVKKAKKKKKGGKHKAKKHKNKRRAKKAAEPEAAPAPDAFGAPAPEGQ